MTDIEIPKHRSRTYRLWEMMPALLSLTMLLLPIILSLINPLYGAIFIVVYIITWFVKTIAMAYRTVDGYNTLEKALRVDWERRLNDLEDPIAALKNFSDKQWRSKLHHRNLQRAELDADNYPKPSTLYNAVIIAAYNESRDVLEPTIRYIIENDYATNKNMILLLAYEERGGEAIKQTATDLIREYSEHFFYAEAVQHPDKLPDEVIGKGGNITWAGKRLATIIDAKDILAENVIVTTLDSDNRPHRSYFSYLTYEFIVHRNRQQLAYQPIALFLNNIWDVPAPMRVIATGNSFWNLINTFRPHMLRNFASHSQGLKPLIEMNFWSVRTIVEDGHQFWRSYFRFNGDYDVIPLVIPIYQDAVLSDSTAKTLKAQFVQMRRWAYGASDIAYVYTRGFRKDRTVPLADLLGKFFRLVEGHVSWATTSLLLLFGAFVPLLVNPEASRSIVVHELPDVASTLQRIAMIGLFITIFLSFKMLPPRPERYKRHRNIFMLAQWVIMPITSVAYGSAAAIYSQTRLLFGKYLDKFDVTDKAVVKDDNTVSMR